MRSEPFEPAVRYLLFGTNFFDPASKSFIDSACQYFFHNFQCGVIGDSTPLNKIGFDLGFFHGPADCGSATMDNHWPHADRFHEHNIDQHVS